MTEIKTTEIDDERFWLTCYITYKIFLLACLVALVMAGAGCTNSGTDGGNCSRTSNCPTDAGQMTVDAGQTNHDTNTDAGTTPDANNSACAMFDQPSPAGLTWDCRTASGGGFECANPKFAADSGQCYAMCEGGVMSAGQVQLSDQKSTWHYFTTIQGNANLTCRPL